MRTVTRSTCSELLQRRTTSTVARTSRSLTWAPSKPGMISSTSGSSSRCAEGQPSESQLGKLCQQAEKHFPVFTDDTRKILAVDDLKKEEVRRGRSEHARSDDCHGFEYAAAYKLKSAVHAEIILTLGNAEEDPIEEVD
jgi:hypothetical protein